MDTNRARGNKEKTQKLLHSLTNLELLQDKTINGTDCFNYRGTVDIAKGIEGLMSQLDPKESGYEFREKIMELQIEFLRLWRNEVEIWIGKDDYLPL